MLGLGSLSKDLRPNTQDLTGYFGTLTLGDLVGKATLTHTRLTYHRTWETGLRVAIRVTTFSPDFFVFRVFPLRLLLQVDPF